MNNNNLAQDLRKSLGLVEEAPLHIDDKTFNDLVSTKRTMYKSNYPHMTKEEFVPRDNPLRPVISPTTFLNLDCEKHASEKIDEWITMIRFTVKSGGYTPGGAYKLCKATMVGNAQKYWESLIAHTPIKEEIDREIFADGVLAIVVDALKREFCGFSLSTESLEKEQSLMALMKLQICDMCYFDNFACEFQKYYYNLDLAAQNYMSELFFAKLPDPWPEVAKTAFQLLLNEDKVVNGLGGRIQAVRYAMRKACTELQIEYVPGRYGCSSGTEEKPRTGYSSKKKSFKGYRKRRISRKDREDKRKSDRPGRFIRKRNNLRDKDRIDAFKKKYGKEPKCPKGKPLSNCSCCWVCGSKSHKADTCPQKNKRRENLRRVFFKNESLAYEPIDEEEFSDIDSEIDSIYEVVSEYETDNDESGLWTAQLFMINTTGADML
ncbi:uncharacterized protein LOC126657031 [Mercurialis annua]|uniref:uncharacterized protein LOC126657031 n=1 Tax=Mercurialis annua TaxID=3986 RepID=UPI002160A2A8|nr:uncharacterized protein LOC126657031 [Mercurialis annua]